MKTYTEKMRETKLFFEFYQHGIFLNSRYGTLETLETILNICSIEYYSKYGNIVAVHYK